MILIAGSDYSDSDIRRCVTMSSHSICNVAFISVSEDNDVDVSDYILLGDDKNINFLEHSFWCGQLCLV